MEIIKNQAEFEKYIASLINNNDNKGSWKDWVFYKPCGSFLQVYCDSSLPSGTSEFFVEPFLNFVVVMDLDDIACVERDRDCRINPLSPKYMFGIDEEKIAEICSKYLP